MRAIVQALEGFAPKELLDKISVTEPLDIRVGYGVDEDFVNQWKYSLEQLQVDPEAELPGAT
jgi:hypothetical protein